MRRRTAPPKREGNVGAAIGAVLPLAVGGAVLLQMPMVGTLRPAEAPPSANVAPLPVAPPPAPLTPEAIATALAPAPPSSATPACLARFKVDRPVQRGTPTARRETLICRRGYVLAYDIDTRDPDWVMERLSPGDLTGPAHRSDAFGHDPVLPPGVDASNGDYISSGYDRGHQAPAGDAKFQQAIMDQSFFFSNMAPQRGIGFNRGAWAYLEETVRAWVKCGGHPDLHVITGPIYGDRPGTIGSDHVSVPTSFFKIVYETNSGRAVGFVLPNRKIGSTLPNLQDYVKPIAWIETETGLAFFSGLDRRKQAQLKNTPGTAWAHVDTCPGEGSD